jgi:hypothetical protein
MKSLVGSIASRLHPNKLITNTESQRLLQALHESFEKHLGNAQPPQSASFSRHHWDSVLHHPMFESKRMETRELASTSISQPAEDFEAQLRRGHMSRSVVNTLCRSYMQLKRSRGTCEIKPLAPSLAAWMATKNREDVFTSPRTLENIIQVMYLDGQEENILHWLRQLYATSSSSSPNTAQLEIEDHFISAMVRGILYVQHDLSLAIQHFIEASKYRHGPERAMSLTSLTGTKAPLTRSWDRLAWFILHRRGRPAVGDEQYRAMLSHAPESMLGSKARISPAFVSLYSPGTARTAMMHDEIQNQMFLHHWRELKRSARKPYILRPFLISLLDAAAFAVSDGHAQRAQVFLNFAHTEFPDVVPEREPPFQNLTESFQQAYRDTKTWRMGWHRVETAFG